MGKKRNPEKTMAIRYRTLQLLESSGIDTERKLIELSPEEIVDLEGITKEQIKQIYHFQRAAKRREFYSYMTGALNYGKANQKQKQAEHPPEEGGETVGSENRGGGEGNGGTQLAGGAGSTEAGSSGAGYAGGSSAVYQNDAGEYGSQH